MNFYRNAAGLLLTSAATIPFGFATSILLARFLTPEDRGAYALALAFTILVAHLAQFGWASASVYRLRRLASDPAEVVSSSLLFIGATSGAAILLCIAIEPWIVNTILRGAAPGVFALALGLVPFVMIGVVMDNISRGIDRFAIGNWYRMAVVLLTLLSALGVLVFHPGGLIDMLGATLAVRVALAAGIVAAVVWQTGLSRRFGLGGVRAALRFGSKNYATALAEKLRERTDLFLIAFFLDPAQVAFFAVAANLVARLKTVTEALGQAAFPELAGLDEDRAAGFACEVSRQSLLWVLSAGLLLGAIAPLAVPLLFGAPYAASVVPVLILLPGAVLVAVYRVLFRYFMAVDMQRYNVLAQNCALAVSVALNLVLIPRYGVAGAAVASVVSAGVESIIVIEAFRRQSGRGVRELLVPRRSDLDVFVLRAARLVRRVLMSPGTASDPASGE